MVPAPNIKPPAEEDGGLTDGAGVYDSGAPVAWGVDVPKENGAAGVIVMAPSFGFNVGTGVALKLKPMLGAIAGVSDFFSAAETGVDPAPNAKGAAGVELAQAACLGSMGSITAN